MRDSGPSSSGDVPTVLVRDRDGHDLLCFLEQLIPLEGTDYALLTPTRAPVSPPVWRTDARADTTTPAVVDSTVVDVVLQEHDLTLVRSAVTLMVSGDDEPDPRISRMMRRGR